MMKDVFWTPLQWPGCEHLTLRLDAEGFFADGLLIAFVEGTPIRLAYQLRCDPAWRARELTMTLSGKEGEKQLELSGDGKGNWSDSSGPLPGLDSCTDLDINLTPLTNTLPIRRLNLTSGEFRDLRVAYVAVPELSVRPVTQRYTRLTRPEGSTEYRYQSGAFQADLPVDADGFVLDYPGIWHRHV